MSRLATTVREDWIGGGLVTGDSGIAVLPARRATPVVAAAQAWFRAAMNAMARPGTLHALPNPAELPDHLPGPAAGLLLSLADVDTPVWLSRRLRASNWAATWIGFHAGASVVDECPVAAFGFIAHGDALPPFECFALGEPAYPDRSATVLIEVESLDASAGPAWRLEGPGILGHRELRVAGVPDDFVARWHDNRMRFPLGIDAFLLDAERFVALPRSVRLTADVTA